MPNKLENKNYFLYKNLGIDTLNEAVLFVRSDCDIFVLEGFETKTRLLITFKEQKLYATLNIVDSDILAKCEVSLSKNAAKILGIVEGDKLEISHPGPVTSLSYVRSKIYGNKLSALQIDEIISDIVAGKYSDTHIASFLTACSNGNLDIEEIANLTASMVKVGTKIKWNRDIVVDKHCVGGLPGNRTTPIVVSIVASFGLFMPKTSSRAITSPAGTADTMEVLTNVEIDLQKFKKIIEEQNGCFIWGGSASLSPADDILIRVERVLDLDTEAQLVASVLSKKIAAGSTHVLIDIPLGKTAKVRSLKMAEKLKNIFESVGQRLGIVVKVHISKGEQPVGFGIGPSLEAKDILKVLKCESDAPQDLRENALRLAAEIIEFSPEVKQKSGYKIAKDILDSGKAYKKFLDICEAQGGLKEIAEAKFSKEILSNFTGHVTEINNRDLARVAKLAGAPADKTAGILMSVKLGDKISIGDRLFTIFSNSTAGINYSLDYISKCDALIK